MKLFIKNMISLRSINEVKTILEKFGLHLLSIELGQVEIVEKLSFNKYVDVKEALSKNDFELVMDKEIVLIERIKTVIIEMVYYAEELPSTKYSEYISQKLKMNYTYVSKFFSHVKKMTIEKFIISQKIERVKQLLLFGELTISEIAWKLNYSSTAHLSAQFKKFTGLTPSVFRKMEHKNMSAPENI